MDPIWLIVLIVVLVAIAVGVFMYMRQRQQQREALRERFGPEYERTVHEVGDQRKAEEALTERTERVERLHIQPLPPERGAQYVSRWRNVQARFVDDPEHALGDADTLVSEVMQVRGYPMGDFEQRAADISVEHAGTVEHFRTAHAITGRASRGEATTEDMREAMLHYRTLFEELTETRDTPDTSPKGARHDSAA
jgi:hypothetical protein